MYNGTTTDVAVTPNTSLTINSVTIPDAVLPEIPETEGTIQFIRGDNKAFDFFVKRNEIEDTLSKIMDWALAEEEYEVCERVKNLNEYLENNQF